MPKPKYMISVDGKDHQVSVENIEKYGIDNYINSYPGATIRMRDDKDEDYDIPLSDFQRAEDSGLRPFTIAYYEKGEQIKENESATPEKVPASTNNPIEPNEPPVQGKKQEQEAITGFSAGFKQGSEALFEGLKGAVGEAYNLLGGGSKRDYEKALSVLDELWSTGGYDLSNFDAEKALKDYKDRIYERDLADWQRTIDERSKEREEMGFVSALLHKLKDPQRPRSQYEQNAGAFNQRGLGEEVQLARAFTAIENALKSEKEAGKGTYAALLKGAKENLSEQKEQETWGDRMAREAGENLAEQKPTSGFGAWAGTMVPQMIGTGSAILASLNPYTRMLAAPLGKANMAALTASTAGSSMVEARRYAEEAKKKGHEVSESDIIRAAGIDSAIEYLTERIPFGRYFRGIQNGIRNTVGKKVADAAMSNKSVKDELTDLLSKTKGDEKLLSKHNITEYMKDVTTEGFSEFAAEALETLSPMIYQAPEDYPTLVEVLENGMEGAKGGMFMGAFLGAGSTYAAHRMNRERLKQQDKITIGDTDNGFVEIIDTSKRKEKLEGGQTRNKKYYTVRTADGQIMEIPSDAVHEKHTVSGEEYRKGYDEYSQAVSEEEKKIQDEEEIPGTESPDASEQQLSPTTKEEELIPASDQESLSGRARGTAIYEVHDEKEMRGAVVRERLSKERLKSTGMSEQDIDAFVSSPEEQRIQLLQSMDDNTRRMAEDYMEQRDAVDGMNDALDEAHMAEVEEAKTKLESMSANDNVTFIDLGKYGDKTHEIGVVVSGMDAEGRYTSPERQLIVVPLEGVGGGNDYNSFDERNAISIIPSNVYPPTMLPKDIVLSNMLSGYQKDVEILESPQIKPGNSYTLATEDGNTFNVSIFGRHPSGGWMVLEEGQSQPELISEEDLSGMIANAESIPYMQEYAEADAQFEEQQKKVQQESLRMVKEQERAEAKQAEEAEKARLAEEMKKPINRLVKYPEGHEKAGKPDYESSSPDDVRTYLTESLGVENAVKSIRNQIVSLEEAEKKQSEKLKNDIVEVANSVLGPDEMISAREFLAEEENQLASTQKSLSFWRNMLEITGGKPSEHYQGIVNKAEAAIKAKQTKKEEYRPGKEYTSAKKRMADSKDALDILNDLNPHTPEELAAFVLSSGDIRITPESLKEESGWGNKDLSGFIGLVSKADNGGVSVREAGDRLMEIDREGGLNILDQYDSNAGLNAIIGALSESRTMGDLNRMVERNRIAQADELYNEEEAAIMKAMDDAAWEEYGMGYDELQKLQDAITTSLEAMPGLLQDFEKSEEYIDFINTFVETKENKENGQERNGGIGVSESSASPENDEQQGNLRAPSGSEESNERSGSEIPETKFSERSRRETGSIEGNKQLSDETGNGEVEGETGGIKPVSVNGNDIETEQDEIQEHFADSSKMIQDHIEEAREMVNTSPTEAQKEAGNYRKGHIKLDGYDISIENPKGSTRSGVDANGQQWSVTMQNDYGYIRGTKAVDGDHIDIFLSDNPTEGNVFVVDQLNDKGEFDESKVMYGFASLDEARVAYLSNYSPGWENRIAAITEVGKEEFKKWVDSSVRKTKPFSEYKSVKPETSSDEKYSVERRHHAKKNSDIYAVKFPRYDRAKFLELKGRVKEFGGYYSSFGKGGFIFGNEADAIRFGEAITNQTITENDTEGKSIESQAFRSEGKADELRDQAGIEEEIAEVGTGGEGGSDVSGRLGETGEGESAEQLAELRHGHKKGDKVMYKGEQAIIYDFDPDGRPVLNTGMAPVIYELGEWEDISPVSDAGPVTVDKLVEMAKANTPEKKLEKAKRSAPERKAKRKAEKEKINDLFTQADVLDKELDKQEQEIDKKLTNIEPINEKENGRRAERESGSVREKGRQETEGSERGRDSAGVHGDNVPDAVGSRRVSESDSFEQPLVAQNTNNWAYGTRHLELPSGEIGKLKGNIEAIRTLKELEESGRPATPEQKEKLLRFVGWGGLADALNDAEYSQWKRFQGMTYWNGEKGTTPWGKKYGAHYETLRPLLTDEEFSSAQASTLSSHYTPETVIRNLWSALEYMGFKGGKILEPAMGIGNILGFMPEEISRNSRISGYELDSIPGRIAKQLYPDASIKVAGYETDFRPNSKDAVVTNVPFGQTAPIDPALDKTLRAKLKGAYNLHNYFIVKGLLELKPGGVGAFVTSSATMDGRNSKAREYIASLGVDLVGAIRLPNNTFKANAGTEVTADILFFRKRLPGEAANGNNFVSLSQVGTGTYEAPAKTKGEYETVEVPLLVNEYFATHPEMMLGTVMTAHDAGSGGLYGGDSQTLVARPGISLETELADAVSRLPENVLSRAEASIAAEAPLKGRRRTGELSVKNGKVYVSDDGDEAEVASGTFKHNKKERNYADAAKDYLELKETLKELMQKEREESADPSELRRTLNSRYDAFVEKYGRLNGNKSLNLILEEDYERFLPQALETIKVTIDPKTGKRSKTVEKNTGGILTARVSQPMKEPETAENLQDAIEISQAYHGVIDLDYISRMLSESTEEVRERILQERQAFEDPVTGDLVDRDAYLSGNVRDKLEEARTAAAKDSKYEANVSELEAAMPETIPFVDIFYKIGTPWIPTEVYANFASDVLGISNLSIRYVPAADEFMLSGGNVTDFTKANDYSTPSRSVIDLFEDAINLRKPTVYRQIDKDHRVKDEDATREAVQRIMDMNDALVRHIQEKTDIHTRLQNIYNDRYNNYRLREYRAPQFKGEDGKIHYPGANKNISLREHQVKAVQRSLQGSTLLAHQVGTGKTFTMITTAMEMRRLGLAKKPMIVVQNATLQDFASDFMKLYPSARILVPGEDERSASQRKRLFNLIATGDFDAIIIPQSFLAFIPDDPGRKAALIEKRIDEIMAAADELDTTDKQMANRLRKEAKNMKLSLSEAEEPAGKRKKSNVKQKAKKEEAALSRETRKLDRRTDEVLTFEQMGIDALFIDEAHNFKKIGFSTKMQNVKGIDTGYSERANSLLLKSSFVQERNGGRNVVLATGTPITNTMAEVWTMMRFVAPDVLEDYNINTFDEFAATFGQVEPSLEFTSTGNFKIADRFKSYVNVPELVKAFRSHADVVLTADVPEFKQSKSIPKLKDDRITNHVIQKSEKLQEVMDVLIEALKEDEGKHGKDKTPGLPLVVFQKAKQGAIDLRLINPSFPDDPESKTNKVVSEVLRIYKESTPDKGVQMIFCDSYQSPASEPSIDLFGYDADVPQFNLYRDIKEKLIKEGIPKEQIVIVSEITNADRKKTVFQKARDGEVRVLIGGTEKMGVGVNVQDRMIALHHMDAPMRPMDFEQRNGRILRQGNMYAAKNMPVEVLTYGVEGTLDATAYDRLRIKQNFINQMMKGNVSGRVMEDEDSEDPSGKTFNQMAAELSGDQTAQMLFIAENNLKKLEGLKRSHEIKKMYAQTEMPVLRTSISVLKSSLSKTGRMAERIAEKFPNGIERISVDGHTYADKLATALTTIAGKYEEDYTLNRNTPPVTVKLNKDAAELILYHDNGALKYSLYAGRDAIAEGKDINTFSGLWLSVNSSLSSVGKKVSSVKGDIVQKENRLKGMESVLEKPFDKEKELQNARGKVSALRAELEEKARKNTENAPETERTDELKLRIKGNYQSTLNLQQDFEGKYNTFPITVIRSMDDAVSQFEAMGIKDNELIDELVDKLKDSETMAVYIPSIKRIAIFADNVTDGDVEKSLFHENVHAYIREYLGDDSMEINSLANQIARISPRFTEDVKEAYRNQPEWAINEEVVATAMDELMGDGLVSVLKDKVSPETKETIDKLLNYIGYDEESERNQRRTVRIGRNTSGERAKAERGENLRYRNASERTTGTEKERRGAESPREKALRRIPKRKPVSAPEEMAGDSYESLDRLEATTDAMHEIAVNAPRAVMAMNGEDILNAMPRLSNLQMAKVIDASRRKNVLAMYVPWSKQIVLLPQHGTVKEIRDANWHESFHFAVDMALPHDAEGRMLLERAASDVEELDPELAKWVDENYRSNQSEEKVVHLLESVISWMEDHGKAKSISAGLDFGSRYESLNETANKIINFLTGNENGKGSDNARYDEGNQEGERREDKERKNEGISPVVRGEQGETEEIKLALRGKPRRKNGESMISFNRRLKEWQEEKDEAERTRSVENEERIPSIEEEINELSMEMMGHPMPRRKPDGQETEADFDERMREWDEWYSTRGQEIRNRMDELRAQAEAERAKARAEEMDDVDEMFLKGAAPGENAPEGFAPDAPDNVNNLTKEEMREIRKSFQSKMDDMKISLSKEQVKKDIQHEIIERRRYIETSNLEDTFFVDELRKMSQENTRLVEKTLEKVGMKGTKVGDKLNERFSHTGNMLKDVIDYIESPAIERMNAEQEAKYKNLTEEANARKAEYEKTHSQFLSVAREWDELENKPDRTDEDEFQLKRKRFMYDKLQQKYLREKKQYEKALQEAESNKPNPVQAFDVDSASPELKELAKKITDWFEEAYNLMAEEGVLYNAPKVQNYVTHIWDWKRSPVDAQAKYANYVNTIRLRSPFTRHRVIPSYAAGKAMGMVPKYDDITGIILEYGHFVSETIANHRFVEFLKNFQVSMPGSEDNMPMDMDIIVLDTVKDTSYSRMDHTALEGYKVLNIVQKYITPVLGEQRILNPKHYSTFTNKLIDGIWATSGLMKKIALSFSFFHHGALTETAIAMLKPWGAAKVIGKNLIWDVVTTGKIPALNDKEAARDAVNHLVSLGASNDYVTADVNNLTAKLKKLTKD